MNKTSDQIQALLSMGNEYITSASQSEIEYKPSQEKWSKKEILGHLIDSAINNLQRFTEIQFEEKPYPIRKYNQDALVISNGYQEAEVEELLSLWSSINSRIVEIIERQTEETLNYEILVDNNVLDLRFLIQDYVDHMEHHLKQIMDK